MASCAEIEQENTKLKKVIERIETLVQNEASYRHSQGKHDLARLYETLSEGIAREKQEILTAG
jgi:hypothetical protein